MTNLQGACSHGRAGEEAVSQSVSRSEGVEWEWKEEWEEWEEWEEE
jgi:hypothetical protein